MKTTDLNDFATWRSILLNNKQVMTAFSNGIKKLEARYQEEIKTYKPTEEEIDCYRNNIPYEEKEEPNYLFLLDNELAEFGKEVEKALDIDIDDVLNDDDFEEVEMSANSRNEFIACIARELTDNELVTKSFNYEDDVEFFIEEEDLNDICYRIARYRAINDAIFGEFTENTVWLSRILGTAYDEEYSVTIDELSDEYQKDWVYDEENDTLVSKGLVKVIKEECDIKNVDGYLAIEGDKEKAKNYLGDTGYDIVKELDGYTVTDIPYSIMNAI